MNRKENPNENYARELQELHTLGVDVNGNPNGYTQADIVEAAKAFTGWRTLDVARPGFRFIAGRHSPGAKQFLGQTVAFKAAARRGRTGAHDRLAPSGYCRASRQEVMCVFRQ